MAASQVPEDALLIGKSVECAELERTFMDTSLDYFFDIKHEFNIRVLKIVSKL